MAGDLADNAGQDSAARAFGALSGIGLLLSAVMPWASFGVGNGLLPSDMGVNQLFTGFTHEKTWISMAVPLVVAGLLMLLAVLIPSRKAGKGMFGRVSSGGSPSGRRVLLSLGTLIAIVTTVLWTIQIGQFRINDGYDFLPGNVQYGAWVGIGATIAGVLASALSYFGAARSVKVPKTVPVDPRTPPGSAV
ncbi:hypothetical protein GCM10010468_53830 [Actinocorallia longicatena]|uniref:Uncharacterized protein n=2 Tax=Actinocorallia longicatena TaxID=111803 RepID=A0ABP6QF73_9ACTN